MARFILLSPVYGSFPNCPSGRKLGTGTTIADSVGNALAGDVVWPALCASPSKLNMAPLDSAAQALIPGSVIVTLAQLVTGNLTVGGTTLDAGN
jgi:hypothetical protein